MAKRLFVRNTESGDPALLCGGPEHADMLNGLRMHIEVELHDLEFSGDPICFELSILDLTDEEVEALPDC